MMTTSELDEVLERQLVVAWAGESVDASSPGQDPRLGWWRTQMTDEYGGADLLQRLTPRTWEWAVLEAARLAASRVDRTVRLASEDADNLLSLFRLGFQVDEQLDARLRDLKLDGAAPASRFPVFCALQDDWSKARFAAWASDGEAAAYTATATGRRLRGERPRDLVTTALHLTAALCPVAESYPLPHYRLAR